MKDIGKLVVSIGVCFLVAFAGSAVTTPSIGGWYAGLVKPPFNPPNAIFGPVWTVLFFLMGIAGYLVWRQGIQKQKVREALVVFLVQLLLNFLWSLFFFGLHLPAVALVDIVILWIAIAVTVRAFLPLSRPAGLLLVPYLAWVSVASVLNLSIVLLN